MYIFIKKFSLPPCLRTPVRCSSSPHPVHQPRQIALALEAQHVHHEDVELVHDVRRKEVAVNFHREDGVVALTHPGREEALDDAADDAGEGADVHDAGVAGLHRRRRRAGGDHLT